jgi:hypothetical protein
VLLQRFQFRVCERIAEREGFNVVARLSDAAISGGTSARRREFDVIVADDSSRLWRKLSEQWRALKEPQDLAARVTLTALSAAKVGWREKSPLKSQGLTPRPASENCSRKSRI